MTKNNKKKLDIPKEAPVLYSPDWSRGKSIPDFVRQVWGPYLEAGLTIRDIRRMDRALYKAIWNYRAKKLPWPEDLKLPSQRDKLTEALQLFRAGKLDLLSPKQIAAVGRKIERDAARPTKEAGRRPKSKPATTPR